jgi:hypothetical protein
MGQPVLAHLLKDELSGCERRQASKLKSWQSRLEIAYRTIATSGANVRIDGLSRCGHVCHVRGGSEVRPLAPSGRGLMNPAG